jgi:aspartate aminotransferase-like enzyme
VVLAGGQRTLDGKIFRIGHLGWVSNDDIKGLLSSLKKVLPQAGFSG